MNSEVTAQYGMQADGLSGTSEVSTLTRDLNYSGGSVSQAAVNTGGDDEANISVIDFRNNKAYNDLLPSTTSPSCAWGST